MKNNTDEIISNMNLMNLQTREIYEKNMVGRSTKKKIFVIVSLVIIATVMFFGNTKAADRDRSGKVIVGATSSGMAIWDKSPNYKALQAHYISIIKESIIQITSDSVNQEIVKYHIINITLQIIFANRLPDPYRITPYNMICKFTDDPVLRTNLINLVSNTIWLRRDNADIVLKDNCRFTFTEGEWHYVTSETEIRTVDYDQVICLVMGVDYTSLDSDPVEHVKEHAKPESKKIEK